MDLAILDNGLTSSQKQALIQKWNNEMLANVVKEVGEMKKQLENNSLQMERISTIAEESKNLAMTGRVLKSHQYGFVNQKDIGFAFNPSIGAKTVGMPGCYKKCTWTKIIGG